MGSCLSFLSSKKTPPAARTQTGAASASSFSALLQRMQDKGKEKVGEREGGGSTDVACFFSREGEKGINQDAMVVWEKFSSSDDTIFCGVFDGHGPSGHLISGRVRDSLPLKLHNQWKANEFASEDTTSISLDEEDWAEPLNHDERLPEMYQPLKKSMLKAFKLMDIELKDNPEVDCFNSGSTAITVIKQGQDLIMGNVGDSRAILGTRDKDNKLVHVQLTVDLNPNASEAARIEQCGGRVFSKKEDPGNPRVWLPDEDSPGLAVARAFGDFTLKDYGVIPIPVISYRRLTEKDEFVVLASDGVWDVLTNEEVVNLVASEQTRSAAARTIVNHAVPAWRRMYGPHVHIDDISVVCLFLDLSTSTDQSQKDATNGLQGLMRTLRERYDRSMLSDPVTIHRPIPTKRDFFPLNRSDEEVHQSTSGGAQGQGSSLEVHQSTFGAYEDDVLSIGSSLERPSQTFHDGDDVGAVSEKPKKEKELERYQATRSHDDCLPPAANESMSTFGSVYNELKFTARGQNQLSNTAKKPTQGSTWIQQYR